MKNPLLLSSLATVFTVLAASSTHADTIANWTFESSGLGSTTPSFAPGAGIASTNFYAEGGDDTGTALAFGLHAGAATYTSPAGNGSLKSLSANTWVSGDYWQFQASLASVVQPISGITLSWDQNGSASGPATFALEYSTDGTTFTQFGSNYSLTSGITWSSGTPNQPTQESFNLSSIVALDTASTIYFRLVDVSPTTAGAINGGNVGTAGTDRVDNFTIATAVVPEPGTLALAAIGGIASLMIIRRRK